MDTQRDLSSQRKLGREHARVSDQGFLKKIREKRKTTKTFHRGRPAKLEGKGGDHLSQGKRLGEVYTDTMKVNDL